MSKTLSKTQSAELIETLAQRFANNPHRHPKLTWPSVLKQLEAHPAKLCSLQQMEETGGEPDAVEWGQPQKQIIFADCAAESPKGRRSLCYDRTALDKRKEHKPANSAQDLAQTMGVELLDEDQYLRLQQLQTFDAKTSSWLKTPADFRQLGGALYGDFRYNRTFIGHNGAESYYAARGFRALLTL